MSVWSIRYFELPLGVATHGTIVVYNGSTAVKSYEGMAFSPGTGFIPIGTARAGHLILPRVIDGKSPNAQVDGGVVFSGTEAEVQARMRALNTASDLMTNQQRPYELPIVDSLNPINSNSILPTFFKVLGIDFPNPVTGTAFGQVGKNNILLNNEMIGTLQSANGFVPAPRPRCFAAGTPVLMADGTEKPIEEVDAGDMVMSFDPDADNGLGAMVPRMVMRTFVNTTRVFIDLYGLKVTPGHEFLSDSGEWMLVADILRRDRAIVRNDENGLGVPYRARTNQPLKSFGDAVFKTRFIDPRTGTERRAEVRGGIPFEKVYSVMSGIQTRRSASLLEVLHFEGRISVHAYAENGRLCDNQDRPVGVLDWPAGTTPFDHEGAENHIVTLDGLPFTPDWILRIPRDGEETRAVMNAGGGADDCLLISPDGVKTMRFEEGKGVFNDRAPRQTLPPQRPVLAASNPTFQPSMNRAQRRKRAALKRVT